MLLVGLFLALGKPVSGLPVSGPEVLGVQAVIEKQQCDFAHKFGPHCLGSTV